MITPQSPDEYPWAGETIVAQMLDFPPAAAADLQHAVLVTGVAAFRDPHLQRLCRCAFPAPDDPPPDSSAELARWCAAHLASGPRGIGLALGALAHAFGHRGWAVVAAAVAAGEAADLLPPFDALVVDVGEELDRQLAALVEPHVTACPPTAAGLTGSPPGHALVVRSLATLARAITDLELPIAMTPTGALERAWSAALAAEPRAAFASRSSSVERAALAAAVTELARTWTWNDFEAWRTGDPFSGARAIARAHGLGVWIEAFESVAADIATFLEEELEREWNAARATAYASVRSRTTDPLVAAIAALARGATASAARLIAERLAAGSAPDAAWIAELLEDPRVHPELWREAAPAVVAAMERQ